MTSGLLVTVDSELSLARAREALACDARLTLGDAVGPRLPLALEARDAFEAEAVATAIGAMEGVLFVDVVYVHFDPGGQG